MNIIGVDIGGTKCGVVRLDREGGLVGGCRITTADFGSTMAEIVRAIDELGVDPPPCFGISYGGPVDTQTHATRAAQNLPGWERHSPADLLVERFGGEAHIMNDANACALAEWIYGAARGCENVIFLTFGTGMGAGIILDGRLYEGTSGLAGEVGHIRLAPDGPSGCGKTGSFEGFCSGGGIAQIARARARREPGACAGFNAGEAEEITAEHVGQAAERGEPAALEILELSGRRLGMALSVLIDILNPQIIVIGSIYRRCRKFLEPPMREVLELEARPDSLASCRIVPAELGDDTGNYAAVSVALYKKGAAPFR